jgi:hypothetical protein
MRMVTELMNSGPQKCSWPQKRSLSQMVAGERSSATHASASDGTTSSCFRGVRSFLPSSSTWNPRLLAACCVLWPSVGKGTCVFRVAISWCAFECCR